MYPQAEIQDLGGKRIAARGQQTVALVRALEVSGFLRALPRRQACPCAAVRATPQGQGVPRPSSGGLHLGPGASLHGFQVLALPTQKPFHRLDTAFLTLGGKGQRTMTLARASDFGGSFETFPRRQACPCSWLLPSRHKGKPACVVRPRGTLESPRLEPRLPSAGPGRRSACHPTFGCLVCPSAERIRGACHPDLGSQLGGTCSSV